MQETRYTKGQLALKRAFSSSDIVVLIVTFVGFFLLSAGYFIVNYFTSDVSASSDRPVMIILGLIGVAVGAVLFFAVAIAIGMILVKIQRQMMLGNALQIEYSAYAWLRDWANEVATDLELPRIELFITQDPVINAYAFGFVRPYTIVLQSGAIRYLSKEQLKSIVVHEMAHVKYGHTIASLYLLPFTSLPVIGVIAGWLAGFWQRRAELTADRLALMYIADAELVKEALIVVHIGPDAAGAMNETARQWQQYVAERPMNRFAQTFSSHPFLVRRLSHIDRWKAVIETNTTAPQEL